MQHIASKILFTLLILSQLLHSSPARTYVGDKSCVACHAKEAQEYKGSDHDLAMMVASNDSVRGDFNHASFNYNGIISTFFKKEGRFMVKTDSEDGTLKEYEIAYTFGVYPLQQYMVKFPQGRIQVLDIAWDSRAKEEGGQKWFHIHADDNVTHDDVLHWTGPNFNWNYMCADCHSTNLKKNYDATTKAYHTTWDSINVSCESCHGPASEHLLWSKNQELNVSNKGFPLSLKHKQKVWDTNASTLKSQLTQNEIDVCAKCHSRRMQLDDDFVPGDAFHEHYLPVNLDENLYFPDGKIQDEVYEYDSFLQSKMYAKGVTCTDCHNPHTLKRKEEGDKVCFQCHKEQTYTATAHHKHKIGSTGSSCIACHMPARTYMGVDSRNDHSFRVPRPDISAQTPQVPNACNLCHTDKNPQWAADAMTTWYGKTPTGKQNFAHSLQALRANSHDAPKKLYAVLLSDAPDIAKATAVEYLGNYPSRQTYTTTLQMLSNSNPQIRRSALQALEVFQPELKKDKLLKLLNDPVKTVRMEATRQLAAFPAESFDETQKQQLTQAFDAYEKLLLFTADRPEEQLSLALFYEMQHHSKKANDAYLEAIRLQKRLVPAYVNYSHYLLQQGDNQKALDTLQQGLKNVPDSAVLHHALGLWYVRNKMMSEAILSLHKAVELEPEDARFVYVYAVAIGEEKTQEAIRLLEGAHALHSGDIAIVSALAYYAKKVGDTDKSTLYEQKLKALQNFSVQ